GRGVHQLPHRLELLVPLATLARHYRHAEGRALPEILVIHFGDRGVDAGPDAVLESPDHRALVLERPGGGDVELDADDADEHGSECITGHPRGRPRASERRRAGPERSTAARPARRAA